MFMVARYNLFAIEFSAFSFGNGERTITRLNTQLTVRMYDDWTVLVHVHGLTISSGWKTTRNYHSRIIIFSTYSLPQVCPFSGKRDCIVQAVNAQVFDHVILPFQICDFLLIFVMMTSHIFIGFQERKNSDKNQ